MTPGKCAVIAEVEEEWVTPLDTRMESLGGVVYRALKADVREDQRKREIASAKADLEQLKIEHAKAQADRNSVWRDAIGNAVKALKGTEFTISRPRDLFFAWSEIIGRIVKFKVGKPGGVAAGLAQ